MANQLGILDSFANGVVRHRKAVVLVFLVAAIVCVPLALTVKVNYDLTHYLPASAQSTQAIALMGEEFDQAIPNAKVLLHEVSVPQALAYKEALQKVAGVRDVLWLDDVVDIRTPLEFLDHSVVEGFYKDGAALLQVSVAKGAEKDTIPAIRELIGSAGGVAGDAASSQAVQEAAVDEVLGAFAILLPAVLLILMLTTTSWLEPLLYLLAIGFAIVLNMGTNVIFGEVSFMTNSVSPLLQMAISLDYAIFLLHAFTRQKAVEPRPEVAMKMAIKESFSSIAASASTTFFGFLALLAMQFLIGADLGINLAKGILLSFFAVAVLLPALTLVCHKLIVKTSHRPLVPSFSGIGRFFVKICPVVALAALLVAVPAFLGQQKTEFLYGKDSIAANSPVGMTQNQIDELFGKSTTLVVLVPAGDPGREQALAQELLTLPHVTSISSYAQTVGTAVPKEYLSSSVVGQFYSEHYARIILTTNNSSEGAQAFETVERAHSLAQQYYGSNTYTAGQAASLLDMKYSVDSDILLVNLIAIGAIFLVLLINFRALLLPLILIFTIESAIWINLAIPYFTGSPINFIGFLVLSSVQLGATVDYAALLTTTFLRNRQRMPVRPAITQAIGTNFLSLLVSAATLIICGFALNFTTSNAAVADIGTLLLRGTVLSTAMVFCLLPALLIVFDKLIAKTTLKAQFYFEKQTGKVPAASDAGSDSGLLAALNQAPENGFSHTAENDLHHDPRHTAENAAPHTAKKASSVTAGKKTKEQ